MRAATAILIATCLLPAGASASSFTELVGLGTVTTDVFDVSPDGDTAVGRSVGSGRGPWVWTESGGSERLDPASDTDVPFGVSNDGVVVGRASTTTAGTFAFRWTEAGGFTDLGAYPGGRRSSEAFGVSDDAAAIAGTYTPISPNAARAFRWTEAGGVEDLGTLPGYFESVALAISGDGSTVVGNVGIGTGGQAMRWTAAGMVALGMLPGDSFSSAGDVSLDGAVAVGYSGSSQSQIEAVRWNGSVIESLLPVPWQDGDAVSRATAVDASGSVIGGAFAFTSGGVHSPSRAVLWTPATGMQYVDQILDALDVDYFGWELSEVMGISADGLTLVGTASKPGGGGGAWLVRLDSIPDIANVPEPSTALLVLAGAIGIATRRRAR
jgi:probable HAF family extracellular repeat protein